MKVLADTGAEKFDKKRGFVPHGKGKFICQLMSKYCKEGIGKPQLPKIRKASQWKKDARMGPEQN
jgi:hypothetical protein